MKDFANLHALEKDWALKITTREMLRLEDQLDGQGLLAFLSDLNTKGVNVPYLTKKLVAVMGAALRGGNPGITDEKVDEIIGDMDFDDLFSLGQKATVASLPEADGDDGEVSSRPAEVDAKPGN